MKTIIVSNLTPNKAKKIIDNIKNYLNTNKDLFVIDTLINKNKNYLLYK